MTAADHWPGFGTVAHSYWDRGETSTNRKPLCRRGGCGDPTDLFAEWCNRHGRLIAERRASAPQPSKGRHHGPRVSA